MSPGTQSSASDYADTPAGWAQRWAVELKAAREVVKPWHESGDSIIKRYRDERETDRRSETRWNLFTANVQTQESLLYGKTPQVAVDRRYADAQDDVARVAGEMLERILNADIERDGDSYAEALRYALQDRLLPGLGVVRIRYVVETEKAEDTPAMLGLDGAELAPMVPGVERKTYECVETDYLHWRDLLWSPARVWHEVRWGAIRSEMSQEQVTKRFGKDIAERIPYELTTRTADERERGASDPWARAVVWEIWDKPSRRVFWYVEGFGETLDQQDDPLQLSSFFPFPRPMLANATTDKVLPRPDFVIAQDLYRQVDSLTTRIDALTDAVKVRGVYDSASAGLKSLLDGPSNALIPVDNWAMFAEKGGLRGVVDWMPLEQVVAAITALDQRRETVKAALYEVTGMSDLLRGQAAAANVTATEQSIKARFASVRLQALQDEFARFASDVQRLKAEVITRLYDPERILEQSNAAQTPDAGLAQQAVELLRSQYSKYRVVVRPEAISMTDFAQMQSERTGTLQAVVAFMTAAAPLAQQMPGSMPFLLRMLQWFVSGQRGAAEIEGVIDQAIAAAEKQAAQPQQGQQQPDPKLLVAQLKAQGDMAKIDKESQARLTELQAEVQADAERERNQMVYNVKEAALKQQIGAAGRSQTEAGNPPRGLP